MVIVATKFRETYQFEGGLEQALVDLVRIGTLGHSSGVRQVASRLVRTVPPEVADQDSFCSAIHEALVGSAEMPALRFGVGELPVDDATADNLVHVDPSPDGDGLTLAHHTQQELGELVTEHRRRADLHAAGVDQTRTVLFTGPPGVGKTMAARWIADTTDRPLVTLNLAAIVSSFLGTSGRNIRAALDYAKSGACVLLLDEFDAVAKRRDDNSDVGELKRIVNVILLETRSMARRSQPARRRH